MPTIENLNETRDQVCLRILLSSWPPLGHDGLSSFTPPFVRTAGCLDATQPHQSNSSEQHKSTGATAGVTECQEEGEFGYLGFRPSTAAVRYSLLVEKLPALLRLVQGGHRLGMAASSAASPTHLRGTEYFLSGLFRVNLEAVPAQRKTRICLLVVIYSQIKHQVQLKSTFTFPVYAAPLCRSQSWEAVLWSKRGRPGFGWESTGMPRPLRLRSRPSASAWVRDPVLSRGHVDAPAENMVSGVTRSCASPP